MFYVNDLPSHSYKFFCVNPDLHSQTYPPSLFLQIEVEVEQLFDVTIPHSFISITESILARNTCTRV